MYTFIYYTNKYICNIYMKQSTLLSQSFAGRKFRESRNSRKIVDFAGI